MTSYLTISSRILRLSIEKLGTSLRKSSSLENYVCRQNSYLPKYAFNTKSVFCQICGSVDLSLRTLSTSQALAWNKQTRNKRPPVVFSKKAKRDPPVTVWNSMTVAELASSLGKTLDELYEIFLFVDNSEYYDRPRRCITNLQVIRDAVKIAGKTCVVKPKPSETPVKETCNKDVFKSPPAPPEELEPRPPIVTIMGHVDHGKTTLLDYLRKSSVVESEFGGITQHIGAFEVLLENGKRVTFLDTPGHAAFSAMRARGANVTDIIVLVVAAEDGAMQQTKESADLAHQSGTPIIVAINKIDKPDADIKKCEESLLSIGIQPESMGGDVQVVPISALKGTNISLLVESLVTQAELLEVKATVKGKSEGTVIESEIRPEGKVATCIIRRGTLKRGCVIVADTAWGKVRNMFNSQGSPVTKALPGTPVQVTGWRNRIPPAGAEFLEVDSEKRAKEVVSFREDEYQKIKDEKALKEIEQKREEHLQHYQEYRANKLELGFRRKMRRTTPLEKEIKEDTHPRLCIVLKGDVDGSVDAILNILDSYQSQECSLELLNFGVGSITPNDIDLAKTFNGIIYTFNLPNITADVKYLLNDDKVPVHQHNIIYRLIEDLQDEISKRLPPLPVEEIIGEAVVNEEFLVSEGKTKVPVAGCRCISGSLKKSEFFRVIRSTDTIYDGELESLKHVKKEVETIKKDVDCGLMLKEKTIRFQPGDKILCYHLKMVNRRTDWNPTGF